MAVGALSRVLVVGGDGRVAAVAIEGARLHVLASSRFGGNGGPRRARAVIQSSGADMVVLLIRWLGHTESGAVVAACRAAGIPVLVVRGSASALKRELAHYMARC